MSKAKNVMSATFNPWAECLGIEGSPDACTWQHLESQMTRQRAKEHAESNPGHRLRVVVEKVDLYIAEES
jgi:hypothetical protein